MKKFTNIKNFIPVGQVGVRPPLSSGDELLPAPITGDPGMDQDSLSQEPLSDDKKDSSCCCCGTHKSEQDKIK